MIVFSKCLMVALTIVAVSCDEAKKAADEKTPTAPQAGGPPTSQLGPVFVPAGMGGHFGMPFVPGAPGSFGGMGGYGQQPMMNHAMMSGFGGFHPAQAGGMAGGMGGFAAAPSMMEGSFDQGMGGFGGFGAGMGMAAMGGGLGGFGGSLTPLESMIGPDALYEQGFPNPAPGEPRRSRGRSSGPRGPPSSRQGGRRHPEESRPYSREPAEDNRYNTQVDHYGPPPPPPSSSRPSRPRPSNRPHESFHESFDGYDGGQSSDLSSEPQTGPVPAPVDHHDSRFSEAPPRPQRRPLAGNQDTFVEGYEWKGEPYRPDRQSPSDFEDGPANGGSSYRPRGHHDWEK
ncbi:hypothetical protein HDE_14348 [Halotydeus destructor]|nr:hypothetical protein HDE_14348 [Halotydeus destructor]